jgi:asparagine synthase (glutamine-hydrolysing)
MGFGIPIDKWFRTSLKATFESVVLQPEMEEYFSIAAARRLWNQHQSGWRDRGPQLWNLLILALWHARHRRSRAAEELIAVKAIPL